MFIEIKVLVGILHNQEKGNSHAKASKGFRVDNKNDMKPCQVLITGSNKFSPLKIDKNSSPGGLKPPTFRLTAERVNRLCRGN